MKKGKILSVALTVFFACLSLLSLFRKNEDINAAGKKARIVSQNIADFYFSNVSTEVIDSASEFLIEDEDGNKYNTICVDYPDVAPPNGTELTMNHSSSKELLKVLYYGWGGPKQWSGFKNIPANGTTSLGSRDQDLMEAYARVATTICATCVRKNKVPTNRIALPFWEFLFGKDNKAEEILLPSLAFEPSNPKTDIIMDEECIRSEWIRITGTADASITVKVEAPYTMYYQKYNGNETKKLTKDEIKLSVGDRFFIEAPIEHQGTFEIKNKYINEISYEVIVADPSEARYQSVAGLVTKRVPAGEVSIPFEAPRGSISIQKISKLEELALNNDCYLLEGAEFSIYKTFTDAEKNKNIVKKIKTDDYGSARAQDLIIGDYYVKETKAPKGYCIDEQIYTVEINGEIEAEMLRILEMPYVLRACPILYKKDGDNAPIGGAKFLVKYFDVPEDVSEDPEALGYVPKRQWCLETNSDGICMLEEEFLCNGDSLYKMDGESILPCGVITIQEIETPKEYVLDDTVYVRNIRLNPDEELVLYNAPTMKNYEVKGKIGIYKKGKKQVYIDDKPQSVENYLSNIEFKIYAAEDIYSNNHILKYKKDAYVTSVKTDRYGYAETGELPVGKYRISETASNANAHFVLMSDDEVEISHEKSERNGDVLYESITFVNEPIIPAISTNAYDLDTKSQMAAIGDSVTIIDRVSYNNLVVGAQYSLVGSLYDAEKKEPIKDADGNRIESSITFTAKKSNGYEEVSFEALYEDLKDKKTVVFEELYEDGDIVAIHKDYEDKNQKIYFASMTTELIDKTSNKHNVNVEDEIKLVDTIYYSNLVEGSYDVKSALVVKETGELVFFGAEEFQYIETSFDTYTGNGEHSVAFEIDAKKYADKTLVCYEYVYKDGVLIGSHEDIEDSLQSVGFKEPVTTEASTEGTTEVVEELTTEQIGSVEISETEVTTEQKETTEMKEKSEETIDQGVKTGDKSNIVLYAIAFVLSVLAIFVLQLRDIKGNK